MWNEVIHLYANKLKVNEVCHNFSNCEIYSIIYLKLYIFYQIHIDGATAKAASAIYRRKDIYRLSLLELTIQECTNLTFRGTYEHTDQHDEEEPLEIPFSEIAVSTGNISMYVYLYNDNDDIFEIYN